jgi:hypothetical protein
MGVVDKKLVTRPFCFVLPTRNVSVTEAQGGSFWYDCLLEKLSEKGFSALLIPTPNHLGTNDVSGRNDGNSW